MPFIASNCQTVGEAIDQQIDYLLNGLYHERQPGRNVREKDLYVNAAARRALQIVKEHLGELWCGDGNTLLKDVPIPQAEDRVPEVVEVTLPKGWRQMSSQDLDRLLDELDDSSNGYELVAGELAMRDACDCDSRIAQGTGNQTGPDNEPS